MIYAITNRKLTAGGEENFLDQVRKIVAAKTDGIILREKDLSPEAYEVLARECQKNMRSRRGFSDRESFPGDGGEAADWAAASVHGSL